MANIGYTEARAVNTHSGKMAYILINMCYDQNCKKHLVHKTATLVSQLVTPLCFSKLLSISETLNNSGKKFIQLLSGELAHHLAEYWSDLYLQLTEICRRASLVKKKSQSIDFASSTRIT